MEFADVVRRRRMVRRFDQRPVPAEVIDRILDTARRAPSAGFAQGVEFLVLDTPETVATFWELTDDPALADDLVDVKAGPPVIVLPIADKRAYLTRYAEPDKIDAGMEREESWPVPFWEVDASMAAMLALLAAVDEGLAGWFFGITYGERELLARFGVPEGIRPIGIIGFGYRAEAEVPIGSGASRSRRALRDQIHRNGW
jgi:nitroreductase